MQDRFFDIKAFAQDPISTGKRTKFVNDIQRDINAQELLKQIESELGVKRLEMFLKKNYLQTLKS